MSGPKNGHLTLQLQNAGVDMDLVNQIMKLKEIEALVQAGKVKQDTYENLIDDVLRSRIKKKEEKEEAEEQEKEKPKKGNMMAKLRNVINIGGSSKAKPSKAQSELPRSPAKWEPASQSRSPSRKVSRNQEVEEMDDQKVVLHDELLRLGMDKQGNPRWKKVKVTLYDDSVEYFVQGRRGEVKNKKVIHLSDEFFVNGEVSKSQQSQVVLGFKPEQAQQVFNQPYLFLLSDVHEVYYFAAEDETKKEFWVTMLIQTIRDISNKKKGLTLKDNEKSKRMVNRYETIKAKHMRDQLRRTLRVGNPDDFIEENFAREEAKWRRQGETLARRSVTRDFKLQEMEEAKQAMMQQQILKKQLADKQQALEKVTEELQKNDKEWQLKYDSLVAKMRQEAQARNEEREAEREKLESEIEELKTTGLTKLGSMSDFSKIEEYEKKLKAYQAKLSALESVLNVDLENLDWDGSLEDAETKMKELVPDLMSADENKQREAQAMFDKWDNIIRNHPDFKNREVNKWKKWEDANRQKNLDALEEMKENFVPKIFLKGCSLQDIMDATGVKAKTAKRVMQNMIFRFFWMDADFIAKIHLADLQNKYASQGLDIRELRAVYACMPDEFQMDRDGKKQEFRNNLRNRLFELTTKEEEGKLTKAEEMHNAYRDKEIRTKPAAPPRIKRKKPAGQNNAVANKALALGALLAGRGAPPPIPSAPAADENAPVPKLEPPGEEALDPDDIKWQSYFKMKKNGLPDGAIMNKLQKDGLQPSLWPKLVAMKEEAQTNSNSNVDVSSRSRLESNGSFFEAPTKALPEPVRQSSKKISRVQSKTSGQDSNHQSSKRGNWQVVHNSTSGSDEDSSSKKSTKKPKKPKRDRRSARRQKKSENADVAPVDLAVKTSRKKKTLHRAHENVRPSATAHLLQTEAKELVDKAAIDYGPTSSNGNLKSARGLNLNYGKSNAGKQETLQKDSAAKASNAVDHSVGEMVRLIIEQGTYDAAEEGIATMKFGELFDEYIAISDMLVGLLLKAKRQGYVKYRGDMLFKGIHDEIKITALQHV